MTGRRPLPPFPRLQCCEKLFAHSSTITVTHFLPINIEVGGGGEASLGIVKINVIFMLATSNIYIFLKSFVVPCLSLGIILIWCEMSNYISVWVRFEGIPKIMMFAVVCRVKVDLCAKFMALM